MSTALARRFAALVAHADAPPEDPDLSALGDLLEDRVAAARAALPGEARDVVACFADAVRSDPDPIGRLAELHAADLWLARSALAGDAAAVEELDRAFLAPAVEDASARVGGGRQHADELHQVLRHDLLVGRGRSGGALRSYRGRGPLRGWLRVTATRELIRLARPRRERPVEPDRLLGDALAKNDAELSFVKQVCRAEVARAFSRALRTLDARQRNLLRYQALDGLTTEQIGAIHGVHQATASRWLARARGDLLEATRDELARQLGTDRAEVDSILRLVRSRLDLSLSALATAS